MIFSVHFLLHSSISDLTVKTSSSLLLMLERERKGRVPAEDHPAISLSTLISPATQEKVKEKDDWLEIEVGREGRWIELAGNKR